jgi:hypothetical protein
MGIKTAVMTSSPCKLVAGDTHTLRAAQQKCLFIIYLPKENGSEKPLAAKYACLAFNEPCQ